MDFLQIAEVFEKLESTSKRLHKILILRDFFENNKTETPLIFDIICGNFTRELDKKKIGISLKSVLSVISSISKKTESQIEKEFNKIGDVGKIAAETLKKDRQQSLSTSKLTLNQILNSLKQISTISGTNSNKKKKEILSSLFLQTKTEVESKFLARLLLDDLRIGASEGVLKEAFVNSYFPNIYDIQLICSKCGYINLNLKECFKCKTLIDTKNQKEIISKNYELIELASENKNDGLHKFDIKVDFKPTEYALRRDRNKNFILTPEPRIVYNNFLKTFEIKYNLLNSFRKVNKIISENKYDILKLDIELFSPIRSMLGTRAKTTKEAFDMVGMPAMADYKYDGLRCQIHNEYGKVRLFSRNLEEITNQFPEVVDFISKNFSDKSFVIDSECVGYDYKTQKFLEFQTLSRRIMSKTFSDVSHINVCVKAFDIMYLDGKTLIEMPYEKRREILSKLFIGRKMIQKIHFDVKELKKL